MQWLLFFLSLSILLNYVLDFSFESLSYCLGVDLMSSSLVFLSFWICSLMLMASGSIFNLNNFKEFFMFIVVMMLFSLCLTFLSLNMFIFYLFFEISLIPVLILILGWGNQPERLQAGIYLLFYTMMASLPMMVVIFYFYLENGSLDFCMIFSFYQDCFLFVCMNLVFLIKMPMFFVHLWLPKAHVEAPVAGSMMLAGIMLKLGGYGVLRLLKYFNIIEGFLLLMSISLMGGIIVSYICLRQSDMKSLIAYSSVVHMSLVLSGIVTMNFWGFTGSLGMMVAHGLCSSGLFCLVNLNYERLTSRSLYLNKGLINLIPSLSLWWFLLISSNMSAPPSFNLMGEIMLINSVLALSEINMGLLMLLSFFGASYSIYLFAFSQHGQFYSGIYGLSLVKVREYYLLFLHWIPLNFLILKGDLVCLWN
uniref:NADH-ubiquinone oxidoreductase chain 4 n=1 Tax=Pelecotoma fennica TaxID=433262 RepID=A0A343A487_9CUCU|nr:NADH dehydrogenase subunit 4 [Pelecotoma fennica]AOY39365.1 NADH dehydrogenase subunit 4 [Pelecotoma fennica]